MNLSELQQKYEVVYKALRRERQASQFVFRNDPAQLKRKVGEMDEALQRLVELKDALKPHCESAEQPKLIEVPRKDAYP